MSYDLVDKIIMKSNLKSGGAYTSIGTYDANEFLRLISSLSEETKQPANEILIAYGVHLFKIFSLKYPQFFTRKTSVFEFLANVEPCIHMEVKKFYIDADLPHFQSTALSPDKFVMLYTSSRPLADLAEGLIKGCIDYHQENIEVRREDIPVNKGAKAKFTLTKRTST